MGLITETTEMTFPYGVFAVALYASAMPTSARPDADRLLDWAIQGSEVLGGAANVTALHDDWIELNDQLISGRITPAQYELLMKQRWPDKKRFERCLGHDLNQRLHP